MKAIVDHTPETSPDYLTLKEAFKAIQEQVDKIEQQTLRLQAVAQLSFYEEHMTTADHSPLPFKLMEPSRFLVCEVSTCGLCLRVQEMALFRPACLSASLCFCVCPCVLCLCLCLCLWLVLGGGG